MSLITFWSPMHGQCANTANTAAASSIIGLEYDIRTLVSQTQFTGSNLESVFIRSKEKRLGSMYDFSDTGIDALERLHRARRLTPENVKNNSIVLERDRLDLLMGTQKPLSVEEMYQNMNLVIEDIVQVAKDYYHAILVDLHSGFRNSLTNSLLRSSDLIVVSLCQNIDILTNYFTNSGWPDWFHEKKKLVIIGQYDPNSKYKVANIKRHFHVKEPIYTVPYCSQFMDAFNDKDILGWFRKNQNIGKTHQNYFFLQEVRKLAKAILDEIGINTQLKLIERGA